jgi:1-deoxy-D-xylulose-5-phosphate reductoisomerase
MILLGSTGSIGVNTLNIAKRFDLSVEVLVAGRNTNLLNEQIKEFNPKQVVVGDKALVKDIDHDNVLYGEEGIIEAINEADSHMVVNSLVGYAGLKPTLESIKLGKKLALANKESLVVGGKFVDTSNITPIDSEHFGLWYLLGDKKIDKMIVTASGGSFRDTPLEELSSVSAEQALNHPNWSMGRKITIDSATMTNKLFELLEAKWLFDIDNLDAVIETKSIIHALIDFRDGSTTAHLAHADMKLPIAYALLGKVEEQILKPVDLISVGSLEFREIKSSRYPIWEIKDDILKNPHLGAVINAANEVAIDMFFDGKISYLDISKITVSAYKKFYDFNPLNVEDIFSIDSEVRAFVLSSRVV